MEYSAQDVLNKSKEVKEMIFSQDGGEEYFESLREDAKKVIEVVKRDKNRGIVMTEMFLICTQKEIEDHMILEIIYDRQVEEETNGSDTSI